jgi:hypothetical protein
MPALTLTVQDGATTTTPFHRELDEAEAHAFIEGWNDGWAAAEDGLDEVDGGRTYDTERATEAYYGAVDLALSVARWGMS